MGVSPCCYKETVGIKRNCMASQLWATAQKLRCDGGQRRVACGEFGDGMRAKNRQIPSALQ